MSPKTVPPSVEIGRTRFSYASSISLTCPCRAEVLCDQLSSSVLTYHFDTLLNGARCLSCSPPLFPSHFFSPGRVLRILSIDEGLAELVRHRILDFLDSEVSPPLPQNFSRPVLLDQFLIIEYSATPGPKTSTNRYYTFPP